MKKVLALFLLALMLVSCSNGTTENKQQSDSTAVTVQQEMVVPAAAIIEQVCDSIISLHPGDIKNKIIQEDLGNELKKYVLSYKGKHMPMLEELTYKLTDVVQDGQKYMVALKYEQDADRETIGKSVQIAVWTSREEAAKYYKGKTYSVKGTVKGFAYPDTQPYATDHYIDYYKPILYFGAIVLDDAVITQK